MSAFAKHSITHLSASALTCWRETPGLYCLRYLFGFKDQGNAAMWRGTASERGMELVMRGRSIKEASDFAIHEFDNLSQGEVTDEIETEKELIPAMISQGAKWYATAKPQLAATQLKVETWLDGVSIPIIGYIDFSFMEHPDLDLKTTKRCPSEPNPNHIRQIALYNQARDRAQSLLYVTDKKSAFFQPAQDDLDAAIADMTSTARSLERFLSVMPDANTAVRSVPHLFEHYSYSDAAKSKLAELLEAF